MFYADWLVELFWDFGAASLGDFCFLGLFHVVVLEPFGILFDCFLRLRYPGSPGNTVGASLGCFGDSVLSW